MKRELAVAFFLCCLLISFSASYCEAVSTSSSDTSTPIVKNNGGEWNEASGSLTVYRRGKAIYGGSDLIPRKPTKNGAQCSLIRPASAITLLTGSAITLLCYLI